MRLEREQILEQVVQKIDQSDIRYLLDLSMDYRDGAVSYKEYYREFLRICSKAGISLERANEFKMYTEYVFLSDRIDVDLMLSDLDRYQEMIWKKNFKTALDEKLFHQTKYYLNISKLIKFNLTPSDWKKIMKN